MGKPEKKAGHSLVRGFKLNFEKGINDVERATKCTVKKYLSPFNLHGLVFIDDNLQIMSDFFKLHHYTILSASFRYSIQFLWKIAR